MCIGTYNKEHNMSLFFVAKIYSILNNQSVVSHREMFSNIFQDMWALKKCWKPFLYKELPTVVRITVLHLQVCVISF